MLPLLPFTPTRRLALICAAGALVLGAAWIWKRFYLVHDIGEGPAGPPVALESFQRASSSA
jgi:hypothetical protein